MKIYFAIAIILIFSSCSNPRLALPYNLTFGQSKDKFIDSMNNYCKYPPPCDYTIWKNPFDTAIKEISYPDEILIDSQRVNFSGYFFNDKLVSTTTRFYSTESRKVNLPTIYLSLVTKYGEPQDSAGFYGKEWMYKWTLGKKYIRMKIGRDKRYGDEVVLEYVKPIRSATSMLNLERSLKVVGPMKHYLKSPLNKPDYQNVLDHYRSNGQDTTTLHIDFTFNRRLLKSGLANIDSLIIKNDTYKRVIYPDSILQGKFVIPGLPFGIYSISIKNKHYIPENSYFRTIICTSCKNTVNHKIALYEKDTILDENEIFYADFYARYGDYDERGGLSYNQILKRDFSIYLSDREVKKLSDKNFIITAYYLKKTGFSDITIHSSDLSEEELSLILKGFSGLKNWKLSRNSNEVEIRISGSDLFSD